MFNHECAQRGGEVVGACMDGFLFGACCQLKSDSQSHIPKGPGVVMTSYLDYPEAEQETDDYDSDQLNAWHHSFKPVVTPGYKPSFSQSTVMPEDKTDQISEGLSQITNTLLNAPPKDNSYVYVKPDRPDGIYTHSTIDHNIAETILLNKNGSIAENVVRPSDFNIQISSMQTKPTIAPVTSTTSTPKTVSTHRPVYTKPVFKPRPPSTTENYVMVSTVTKDSQKVTELSSIDSIIQMLNNTPSMDNDVSSPASDILEHKSSLGPTVSPVSSSTYLDYYVSPGHYVTVKPSTSLYSTTLAYDSKKPYTPSTIKDKTSKPISQTYKPHPTSILTVKPGSTVYSTTFAYHTKKPYFTTPNSIQNVEKTTSRPQYTYSSPSSISQSTSEAIDAFNRYPTDPNNFGPSLTTFTYVTSSTTPKPTTTKRRPPSTSYVTGSTPARRPVTPSPNIVSSYDSLDTFSSATPTVIVLNSFQTPKPETSTEEKEPEFVEISQEPFKKPVSQITVNNHIESTNNIYMGKPPQTYERPSSPTVVITPKPPPNTTPYPLKASTKPVSASTSPSIESYTDYYSPTTFKPELQTSPDDLINFPPVRNPMLNVTGSNPIFNTSITMSNDLEILHDEEFTTPSWQEDEKLNEKMNQFVNKIVGSLQGTFQELHDIVILDKKPNITNAKTTTPKPTKKTPATTKKPLFTTTKKPIRLTTTTKKPPVKTTKKPTRLTTVFRRPTTTAPPVTTTSKKPVRTKPTRVRPSRPVRQ